MKRLFAIGTLCLLAGVSPASAEWHFTPMAGITFSGDTTMLDWENATNDAHPNFGGAVSILGGGLFGVEGIAISTPGFFKSGNRAGTAPRVVCENDALTGEDVVADFTIPVAEVFA